MIRFRTLGALELSGPDGREVREVLTHPKRTALLAYLNVAVPRRFHRRDSLLGLFWPELDQEHARAALRQALYGLRRELGSAVIQNRGDEEIAAAEDVVWSDVAAFDQAVAAGDTSAALDLYRGDFLEGFFLPASPEFEHWMEDQRARLRRDASRMASQLAQRRLAEGDPSAAADAARRAHALAPDDEGLARQLISVLDAAGDRAAALAAYEDFTRRLAAEFETQPSAETQALIAAVRARTTIEPAPEVGAPLPTAAMPLSVPRPTALRGRWHPSIPLITGVAVVLVSAAVLLARASTRSVLDPRRVVVVRFENRTGDSTLDVLGGMAADWVARGLAETGLVEVADARIEGTDPGDVRSRGTHPGPGADLIALAKASDAGTVVSGAFYRQSDSLRFEARLTDATGRKLLRSVEPATGAVHDPRGEIETLRQHVMGSLAAVLDPRLAEWSSLTSAPPSFEAYEAFASGFEKLQRLEAREALVDFARAAAMDSTYAVPLIWAAHAHAWLGECAATDSLVRQLSRTGRPLARFDRFSLDRQAAACRGDGEAQYRASREMADLFPGSEYLALSLGRDALQLNRPEEARATLARLHPDRGSLQGFAPYYLFLVVALHQLEAHRRELDVARRGRRQYADNLALRREELFALAALGRTGEITRRLDELLALPPHPLRTPIEVMRDAALELQAHGHPEAGQAVLQRTLEWAATRPAEERATNASRLERLKTLYAASRWAEARVLAESLSSESPDSADVLGITGALAAQRGDGPAAARADSALATLRQPGLAGLATYWRGCIAAQGGDRARAVALLLRATHQPMRHAAEYFMMLHTDPSLVGLRDYPPFQALLRPKG